MAATLRVEKMGYGGDGIARDAAETMKIALPFVLPGELVRIAESGSVEIVEPSASRVAPGCIHFGECGGCHYQHASYAAQVAIKTEILRDVFTAAGVTDVPEIVAHTGEPWRYRNRIRLRVGKAPGANRLELRVGYNRREAVNGASAMLPISMCPIASPLLWHAARDLVALARTTTVVSRWVESAAELELFVDGDETKLQMLVFVRGTPRRDFQAFCDAAHRAVPQLAGAGVAILPTKPSERGRRSERTRPGPQWGASGMIYAVERDKHWVSRGSFFQVNRFLVSELIRLATANRSGTLAWDLYAGVGLFSRALARSYRQVVAVEAAEPAAIDLALALKGTPHRAFAMTALDFLRAAVIQRERPDLIVMDPPRAGIGAEACAFLTHIGAPEIVYVSCDPVTLARDIRQLTAQTHNGGAYKVSALHMVDMFPQTFHIECVAILHFSRD